MGARPPDGITSQELSIIYMSKPFSNKARQLIGVGYLPKELPLEFTSIPLAKQRVNVQQRLNAIPDLPAALPETFNLARQGYSRRVLSIVHPAHYMRQVDIVYRNWPAISEACGRSTLSISRPTFAANQENRVRATNPVPAKELSELRLSALAGYRFVLQADFARFFASIYTHSIPWALHGKSKAKKQRGDALFGNQLDKAIRNGQDGQTVGIPVGPDASHIVSEIIASAIDALIGPKPGAGYRFIDDYFLCFEREAQAMSALESLANAARAFEIELSYEKTSIQRAEDLLETIGLDLLRDFSFDAEGSVSRRDLHELFATASRLSKTQENALKYAIRMLAQRNIPADLWEIVESYLLRSVTLSPNCLEVVAFTLYRHNALGAPINVDRVVQYLTSVIMRGITYNRHSDVCWALWIFKVLAHPVPSLITKVLSHTNNSIIALLTLDLRERGLLKGTLNVGAWVLLLTKEELYRENWMLVYESAHKGWLSPRANLWDDPFFGYLHSKNISFYEDRALESLARSAAELTAAEIRERNVGPLQPFLITKADVDAEAEDEDSDEYEYSAFGGYW